ncbi:MAG: transglutaminase [Acidobacteria bacterium]|nr:transglutaminase [Acidobacteriota bacterium]
MSNKLSKYLAVFFILFLFLPVVFAEKETKYIKRAKVLNSPTNYPAGMTWDGKNLWLLDRKDGLLLKLDDKGEVIETIKTPGYRPSGLTWDGEQLWISDLESNLIYRLNPKNKTITRTIESPVSNPYGLAWDGKLLWLLNASKNSSMLSSIDPDDGTTIISFKAPFSSGTGLTWDGKYLWASDRVKNELYMICPKSGNVINVLHAPGPFTYGLAWDGKNLWNVDYETDKIYGLNVEKTGNFYLWGEKKEKVILTTVINNQGNGTVKSFDLYYAVPRNLDTQKILKEIKWNVQPEEYLTDKWGQKVAHFQFKNIKPAGERKIEMAVELKTNAIRYIIFPDKVTGEIPADIKAKYLVDDLKFDLKNPYIQDLAKKIVGDEKNPYWKARKLFNYLIANMYYDLSGGWNTAPTVLKRGSGSCSEYSFSYIALCRAVGIPARYVGTLVIRGDDASWDDVYHRWTQIYLPGYGWVNVDGNRGDKDWPGEQALAFGGYSNSFLMTTEGGGGSQYLKFNYNYDYSYSADGRVNVRVNQMAEWEPIE